MNNYQYKKLVEESLELHNSLLKFTYKNAIFLLTKSEELTLDIRRFIANNLPEYHQKSFEKAVASVSIINIEMNEKGVISIDMPPLLPFKKVKDIRQRLENINDYSSISKLNLNEIYAKANAILYPLDIALKEFFAENKIKNNYKNSTFVFTNYCNSKVQPDPDNFEYKQVIDVVTDRLSLNSDNGITIAMRNVLNNNLYTNLTVYPDGYFNS
ncbi:MAG: hypothetical protein ACI4IR_00960 [Eubacterium sp.]